MVFERFNEERLKELLAVHQLSPEGREFLEKALIAPSRNVQGSRYNIASDLPCPKMWGNAQAESWSSENAFTLEHIFNPRIIGYTNQVPSIELHYKGRNGRTVRTPYTGDCLCFDQNRGFVLEEWKPESDREILEEKYPGKYHRLEPGEYSSVPICNVVNPWGIHFAVRFSDEISHFAHRNRRFLYHYLAPGATQSYLPKLSTLLELFEGSSYRTYADLVTAGAEIDVLNWAIATNRLCIDFDSALISTSPETIIVFKHSATLEAWKIAVRPDGQHPAGISSETNGRLNPGDVFHFDGKRLTVTLEGATTIYATDEFGNNVAIDHEHIANAVRAGKVTLPNQSILNGNTSRFASASPSSLNRAIRRVHILQDIEQGKSIAIEDQYSDSTQRRWRRAIKEGELQGLSPVESLLDFEEERGFRGPHIDLQFSEELNSWIKSALKDNKNQSTINIYYDLKEKAEKAGFKMVARSSLYERVNNIKSLKTIRSSQGFKTAYQLEPTYWMLDQKTPVHCERALELVHIDSTLLDVELISSLSGEKTARPWLTIAFCAASRRVVGMYMSYRPPSYVSSMMVLADIVKRFGRLPDAVIHDWGSEFKAKDWKNALTALFIARHVRPKSCPRFGSVIERFFGIATRELIDNVAGNTKIRKNVRQISPESDPSIHSGLYMADLYQGLEEYFFENYDNRKHPTTLEPPRAFFESSLIVHGTRLHRLKLLRCTEN